MNKKLDILEASKRISKHVRETFFSYSPSFSNDLNNHVWFKLENLQHTGSFKVRGAFNKLLNLSAREKSKGVLAASTGNHGAAIAYASKVLDISCIIYVPYNTSPSKLDNMKRYGASIEFYGDDCIESELKAREVSIIDGKIYISPYNDLQIIEGQGSIGYEISNQINQPLDAIIVSVGGGGLISGISGYLKSIWPNIKIIGCSPVNSAVMLHSIKAGEILSLQSKLTLSDGTAGGVEKGSVTFPFCENYIDESVLVSEEEIKEALIKYMDTEHQMIEGAAGTAVAALIKKHEMLKDKRVGVIICGGNINLTTIKSLL